MALVSKNKGIRERAIASGRHLLSDSALNWIGLYFHFVWTWESFHARDDTFVYNKRRVTPKHGDQRTSSRSSLCGKKSEISTFSTQWGQIFNWWIRTSKYVGPSSRYATVRDIRSRVTRRLLYFITDRWEFHCEKSTISSIILPPCLLYIDYSTRSIPM